MAGRSSRINHRHLGALALVLVLYLGVTGLLSNAATFVQVHTQNAIEDVSFAVAPNAVKAYQYGEKHFDASHAKYYDTDRAMYFFLQALRLSPDMPLVHHQIARLLFLRGDFSQALYDINRELEVNPSPSASSYYMKGLILGFMARYDEAAASYEIYLKDSPTNWAGVNDYAWVLMKAKRYKDAKKAIEKVIGSWPENPWLWNSYATALFELGDIQHAAGAVEQAQKAALLVKEEDWLQAYPGNDPLIAKDGVIALKKAIDDNMHSINAALEKDAQ